MFTHRKNADISIFLPLKINDGTGIRGLGTASTIMIIIIYADGYLIYEPWRYYILSLIVTLSISVSPSFSLCLSVCLRVSVFLSLFLSIIWSDIEYDWWRHGLFSPRIRSMVAILSDLSSSRGCGCILMVDCKARYDFLES